MFELLRRSVVGLFFVLGVLSVALYAAGVFAGAGVSPQPPDLGFDWPQWVITLGGYLDTITTVIGSMAVIAAITPTPKDNQFLRVARAVVDFLGANFYNAKNEER